MSLESLANRICGLSESEFEELAVVLREKVSRHGPVCGIGRLGFPRAAGLFSGVCGGLVFGRLYRSLVVARGGLDSITSHPGRHVGGNL